MNSPLSSVNALGTLLLVLGILLFNNSLSAWQFSRQAYGRLLQAESSRNLETANFKMQQQLQRLALVRQTLLIVSSVFLILLGAQILRKQRWACHFFFSIRQLAQLAQLLLPLGTFVILLNGPLLDNLVEIYQPLVQEVMQSQSTNRQIMALDKQLMRLVIQISFWFIALLGVALATLTLSLSKRCLRPEVQEILNKNFPSSANSLILCIPMELLVLLLLSVYGTARQLLEILLALLAAPASSSLILHMVAFACFALALLQLTNHDIKQNTPRKFQLLQKSLGFCSLGYLIQLLHSIQGLRGQPSLTGTATTQAIASQINSLGNVALLLLLGLLYRFLLRAAQNGIPNDSDQTDKSKILAKSQETATPPDDEKNLS